MTFREGMGAAGFCVALGLALTAWGCASLVIVPVDHLVRARRRPVTAAPPTTGP